MKENNKTLFAGLAAVIGAVALVALVGLFAIHPPKEIVTGEADASEYRVSNKVPGRVDSIYVKEGMKVKAGDTLAHISSPQVEAKMLQAEAVKNAASAQSRKARGGARNQQKEMAYQVWQKAKAAVEVYRKSYERVKGLYEKGVVSAQKFDEVEAQYKVAQADCAAAEQQYLMAKEGAQAEDIQAAAALVNQAGGAVAEVQSYLDDSYLIAPSDGEVVEVYVKLGDLIGTGSPVMSILNMDDCWFFFAVREDLLKGLETGENVKLRIPALGEEPYDGTVSRIQAMASYATWRATKTNGQYDVKSFDVKVVPANHIEGLRPGMTAILEKIED
ncbi:MAG: efflux RND transporter periplasmic adaptor subunit [Bacteroidales bacterium]|nr:efflux RND transporter periplasmic adaptor subunit [Bacteroidales bacterium]